MRAGAGLTKTTLTVGVASSGTQRSFPPSLIVVDPSEPTSLHTPVTSAGHSPPAAST